MNKTIVFSYLILFFGLSLSGQQYTISGYVIDDETGETLIGANVYLKDSTSVGVSTNIYGFYSLTLPKGKYNLSCSYLGYNNQIKEVELIKDLDHDFRMRVGVIIDEVTIEASRGEEDKNISSSEMGTVDLPVNKIKNLPVIFGEVDILKTIQLLPGVLSSGEGTSGFYVRGGGPDQNLVLLDEAVVYNSGHLLGFFSVFNADAIKNTNLIKGGMPARYGGRLSSVLDIQMKEGNDQDYSMEGGIGLVASRLTVQGPIKKNVSSFIISGRRTYIGDLAQFALNGSDFEGTNYYFYDLNAKINYRLGKKDRLYFSSYFGRDVLNFRYPVRDFYFDLPYGNATATLRWNHLFNNKLFFNLSAIYNSYDFSFSGGQDNFVLDVFSGVEDWNLKADFDYYPRPNHDLKFGIHFTYHTLTPNTVSGTNGEVDFNSNFLPKYAYETALYLQDDIQFSEKLSVNSGLRIASFTQLGPYTSKLSNEEFERNEPVTTYIGWEPRINIKYQLTASSSMKAGITYTNQFLHLVSNSSSTLPTDVWVPSTELVRPQQGTQYALGYYKNFKDNVFETSLEIYYRNLQNQIDYADNFVEDFSGETEDRFVFGSGRAYGTELFLKKSKGRLTGWLGYTVARTDRSFPEIEDGRRYPAIYDRLQDISVVTNYEVNDSWELGGAFIYGSGRWYTPINGFFFIEQNLNVFYGPRNSRRLDAYHRMDLSLTYTPNPNEKKSWQSSWTFSLYNVYNRKNPFFINYDLDTNFEQGQSSIEAYKITIFPLIPSITYNFKWK